MIEFSHLVSDRVTPKIYNLPFIRFLHCLIKLETICRGGEKGVFSGMKEKPKNHEMVFQKDIQKTQTRNRKSGHSKKQLNLVTQ